MHEDRHSPRILLVRPLGSDGEPEFAEPLGIERIAGYLKAHGYDDVYVFDRRLYQRERGAVADRVSLSIQEPGGASTGAPQDVRLANQDATACVRTFWEDIADAFGTAPPALVGFSLMTAQDAPDALKLASRMRALWPRARFAAGGLYVTTAPDEARRKLGTTMVLLSGEGEGSFLALADARGTVAVRGSSDPPPPGVLSPDEWAFAYRPHLERYARLGCAVNMQTSRGCPGACTFCATPLLPNGLGTWRPRRMKLVVDEVEREAQRLSHAGLPAVFNFVDDDFGSLDRVEELVSELACRHLRVAFSLEMRLKALIGEHDLAERLAHLHDGGLTRVFFGVESLEPEILRAWRKPYDADRLPEVLDAFRYAGITVQAGYILWHAGQTVEGALGEVVRLHDLGIFTHRAAQSRMIVFPGCMLAGQGRVEAGFEQLGVREERFLTRFSAETQGIQDRWMSAALAEPYAIASAWLSGNAGQAHALQHELKELNEVSFQRFVRMAEEICASKQGCTSSPADGIESCSAGEPERPSEHAPANCPSPRPAGRA